MGGIVSGVQLMRARPGTVLSAHITQEKEIAFLAELERSGNISAASDAVGISRTAAWELRQRNPAFDAACLEVMEKVTDRLEEKIRQRAEEGTAKGVWYRGDKVGEEIEHHDVLAMFMLKGGRPEQYRENQGVQVNVGLSVESTAKLSDAELESVVAARLHHERALDANTLNVFKEAEKQSRERDKTAKQDVVQRSARSKGPVRSKGRGRGIDATLEGDPKDRQRPANPPKSRKRAKR